MTKNTVSLGAVWEDTVAFLKAELSLVAPVSLLGFGLPMVAFMLAVPADEAVNGKLQPGPWMLWMFPCGFVAMLGSLAVSSLVLTPNVSVKESIVVAFRRIPTGLGLFLLYLGLQVVLSLPLALANWAEGGMGTISMLDYLASLVFVMWVLVRVMPIWAIVADRPQTPWASVMRAFELTRGCTGRLIALRLVMGAAALVTLIVLLLPIGAVTRLIGVLAGNADVGIVIAFLCLGVLVSAIAGIWTVYVAHLYRRLEVLSKGT
ncbi:hypothetical protein DMC47_41065 [Nostoc sp. 3335mG]|nr:hypothetical protein DMC47_41065 [Nostoc sp. 3335mG]